MDRTTIKRLGLVDSQPTCGGREVLLAGNKPDTTQPVGSVANTVGIRTVIKITIEYIESCVENRSDLAQNVEVTI